MERLTSFSTKSRDRSYSTQIAQFIQFPNAKFVDFTDLIRRHQGQSRAFEDPKSYPRAKAAR